MLNMYQMPTYILLISSFFIALILEVIAIPSAISGIKPAWVTLILIYWIVYTPNILAIKTAFLLGIYMDLIVGNLMGTMGLSLSVVAYLSILLRNRFINFSVWQNSFLILILVAISQLLMLWVYLAVGKRPQGAGYWLISVASMVAWPIICICIDALRSRYKLN